MIRHTIARIFTTANAALWRGIAIVPVYRFGGAFEEGARRGKRGVKESDRAEGRVQNRNLWQIFSDRKDVLNGTAEIKEIMHLCRSIARFYTHQRSAEFKNCKEEIDKLINLIASLPLADLSLESIFAILDFLAVVLKSQQFKKEMVGSLKDLIFFHLKQTIKNAANLTLWEVGHLYAKLAPFNHPDLSHLANTLQTFFGKMEYRLDLSIAESIFLGLHQRKFLSPSDNRILKLVLKQLQAYSSQIFSLSLARIMHAVESMSLRTCFADTASLTAISHLQERMLMHIETVGLEDEAIAYLVTSPYKNQEKSCIRQTILNKIIKALEKKEVNAIIIPRLISCLRNRGNMELNDKQTETIFHYVAYCDKDNRRNKVAFSNISQQNALLDLVSCIKFGSYLSELQEIITKQEFQVHWSLVVAYGLNNKKFPLTKLQAKIKPKTSQLSLDGNYLKAAVSIDLQHNLHKDSAILKQTYESIITSLQKCDWNETHLQWLGRQTQVHSSTVRAFHQLYHHTYFHKLSPAKLSAVSLGRYFNYIVVNFHQQNCRNTLISQFPLKYLQSCILRQLGNEGSINIFLLYLIDYFTHKNAISYESNLMILIVRLLLHYSGRFFTSEEGLHLYQNIVVRLNDSSGVLTHLSHQLNQILKRMVACSPSSLYYRSFHYCFFLNEMIQSISKIKDTDLLVMIIRAALNKNMVRTRHVAGSNLPLEYFSEKERERLEVISKNTALDVAKPETLSLQNLEYALLCLNKPIKGDAVNQKLFQNYIDRFVFQGCNFPALLRKQNFITSGELAYRLISKVISSQAKEYLLHDHLSLVSLMLKNNIRHQVYFSSLFKYLNHNYEKFKSNQTFIQLYCMAPLLNIQLAFSHIKDMFSLQATDPRPQLRLIALLSYKLDKAIATKLVAKIAQNSLVPLQKDYYNWFLELNYGVDLKLVNLVDKKEKWGRNANQREMKAAEILKANGETIKEQKLCNDTVYFIGNKTVIFLAQYPHTLQLLQKFLNLNYPNFTCLVLLNGSKEEIAAAINIVSSKSAIKPRALTALKSALLQ